MTRKLSKTLFPNCKLGRGGNRCRTRFRLFPIRHQIRRWIFQQKFPLNFHVVDLTIQPLFVVDLEFVGQLDLLAEHRAEAVVHRLKIGIVLRKKKGSVQFPILNIFFCKAYLRISVTMTVSYLDFVCLGQRLTLRTLRLRRLRLLTSA